MSGEDPLAEGLRAFEAGSYYEAHEAWEEVWRQMEQGPDREALQGLIQAAAALYHLERDNLVGARKVGARALERLRRAPSPWCGLRLRALGHVLERALDAGEAPASVAGLLGGGGPGRDGP
ncbi:MAG: DUF309 domain-containing protein [Deltaproteobacteria bacterium]|nr:DUF309 domain-containing protein [Deltaproteobacteria bacterium]MCB9787778.1 DUF309 domain-containing protein [Deltaproteobacteria bacterium]